MDNAIDACRWRGADQDAPTVRVVLRPLSGATIDARNNEDDAEDHSRDGGIDFTPSERMHEVVRRFF